VLDSRRDTGHKAWTMPTKSSSKSSARAKKAAPKKAAPKKAVAKARATRTRAPKIEKAAAAATLATGIGPRRAVFIDVENTSSESELARVLNELNIDLTSGTTDVTAIGNWRVVGQQLGRSLAQRGAHLVHSAPATRVPDWSDLWIAVHAGIWLGRSRPGDAIDIVSHDRAFDAVGDAAARLGVTFNRITYRSAGPSAATERASDATGERRGGRRRRRRGGSGRSQAASTPATHTTRVAHPVRVEASGADEERHAASHDQLQQVIARLAAADAAHTVTLDALTVALKAAGFQRPPGSPRLVTRLRRMKDIEVLPNGRVRLVAQGDAPAPAAAEPLAEPTEMSADAEPENGSGAHAEENGTSSESGTKRRPRRRGGRRRGGRGRSKGAAPAAPSE
jgi:hypothetical protein